MQNNAADQIQGEKPGFHREQLWDSALEKTGGVNALQ